MIIPLDTAHEILATFGITNPSREYERWIKDEGFDLDDFPSVLFQSEFIFVLDWRGCLADELERIVAALDSLGVEANAIISDDEQSASVTINGATTQVSYSPTDQQTNWLAVISALQFIVPANIEFRESVKNGGSDTEVYAVLPKDEWHELATDAAESMQSLFRPLSPIKR